MAAAWLLALAPLIGLGMNVAAQIGWARPRGGTGLLRSVLVGFSVGGAVTLALGLAAMSGDWTAEWCARLAVSLATYGALGYGYFHFINLGETARRVRLLWEFVEAGGPLTADEVLTRYNGQDMVRKRFGRLLRNRQVVHRNGRYYIDRPTVLAMARLIGTMKWLLLGRG